MTQISSTYYEDIFKYIDTLHFKTQYIKIIILDNTDCPLRAIEGRATGGSININGSSAMRRSGSLTLVTEPIEKPKSQLDIMHEVTNIKSMISMNKRVKIEIGIENSGQQFLEQKKFWISLGIFAIQNASVTHDINNGITIQLKLIDKMAFLSGELGGTFASDVTHSPLGYITNGQQTIVKDGVKVRTLVNYLLQDFAELNSFEYRIEDVPDTVRTIIRWTNKDYNLCITELGKMTLVNKEYVPQEGEKVFKYAEAIGYTETDFVYPLDKDLDSKAGESIVSVLDKIKNTLGNYEYYFDIDGVFHFREIRNFFKEGSAVEDLTKAIAEKYFFNVDKSKSVYSFKDSALVTSYSNNPQYNLIKNDFTVWGEHPITKLPIQYHLLLQKAPNDLYDLGWILTTDENGVITKIEHSEHALLTQTFIESVRGTANAYYLNFTASERPGEHSKDDDWRLRLYCVAMAKTPSAQTPFDREVIAHIPQLYNLTIDDGYLSTFFTPLYDRDKPNFTYWLDIINTDDINLMTAVDIQNFGIDTIGRKVKTFNNKDINCLFASYQSDIMNMDFIEIKCDDPKCNGTCKICSEYRYEEKEGHHYWYIGPKYTLSSNDKTYNFWTDCVSLGTVENSAYDFLRSALYEYLSYNGNINIQSMPVYHLDVNQRITVDNTESDIHGDYIVNSITVPLTLNGMMTVNARKAVERI